jgi:anti-anti-sigma factor
MKKAAQDVHVACILNNTGQTFWALCGQGIQDRAYEHGATVSMHLSNMDGDAQSELEDCLRQPQVDAVILAGAEASLTNHAATASAPRIPLVTCSGVLHGLPPACDLQPDLGHAAELAASHLVERLHGRGKVVHIQGLMSNEAFTQPRSQGFSAVVAQHPGITIAFEGPGNFDRATAAAVMQAALAAHPDVRGVYAHNDEMALGALEALEAAGRRDVVVVGIDGIPESLTAVKAGRMGATVDTSPYSLGRMTFAHTLDAVQGRPTPATVLSEVRLITVDNLVDATLDIVRVLPTLLRNLIEGNRAQRRLQDEIIATQQGLIQELSTPIIPVSDEVLVVPLIGAIDSGRAAQITESLLTAVSRHQHSQVMIIDITGVAVVDTSVIHYLLQAVRALRLLGTTVLLVGIAPEVAQTIVQLGVDLSSIVTRSTLQAGLEYAMARLRR